MTKLYFNGNEINQTDSISVEEYDTTVENVEWYVRRWNSGYCELSGTYIAENIAVDNIWGNTNLYYSNAVGPFTLPVTLIQKLQENCSLTESYSNGSRVSLMLTSFATNSASTNLKRTNPHRIIAASNLIAKVTFSFYVTGMWK